jgi:DNA polymerase III subunit epsilon
MNYATVGAVSDWAVSIMQDPSDVVFLDAETTGTSSTSEIVDISIVEGTGKVLIDTLVQPLNKIPTAATAIHGITNQDVAGAPWWPEVYTYIHEIFTDHRNVVIYNLQFDVRLMNQTSGLYAIPKLDFAERDGYNWHCAMKKYSEFAGVWNPRFSNYRWHKLSDAVQEFGIDIPEDIHRALADAEMTRKLVIAMAGEQEG